MEICEGTVFFVDMRNFTLLCSRMAGNICRICYIWLSPWCLC